ncbi:hypothetical protein AXF42_Ash001618 [Apostasia shenzhenica]|uniref:Uncharacterized protein n=1 Tax=Apostasia shenzhenica TaxID=1088818 RepID=A0A2I0AAQ2_9ASPA|nr:hypothetical protein AXF42_Ash001618 [Apostasia shenzhenica]
MGGCFSRSKKSTTRGPRSPGHSTATCSEACRAAPPEEEKVKEVLSETPTARVSRALRRDPHSAVQKRGSETEVSDGGDDRSEATTEICSFSDGLSVSLGVMETPGEEPAQLTFPAKFQRKRSSSASEVVLKRERGTGAVAAVGCRTGRSSPSPSRRTNGDSSVRTRSVRESMAASNSGVASTGIWQDPGERSGRRSVSPATKASTAAGKCRSVSSSRATVRSSPRRNTGYGVAALGRERGMAHDVMGHGAGAAAGGKESLENPLVSMECFIFL